MNTIYYTLFNSLFCGLLSFSTSFLIKRFSSKTFYFIDNKYMMFGVILTSIGSVIGQAISSNIYLSLGMLGALSIIRFRTPIRSVMEMSIIFFYVSLGIIAAANISYSLILSLLIITSVIIFSYFDRKNSFLIFEILLTSNSNSVSFKKFLEENFIYFELKGQFTNDKDKIEYIYQCKSQISNKDKIIDEIEKNKNIKEFNII